MIQKAYFIRHGKSQANQDKIFAGGGIDSPLVQEGIDQAHTTGKMLVERGIFPDKIIASDSSRTRDTAQIIAAELGYPVDAIDYYAELRERNVGTLAGMPLAEFYQTTEADVVGANGESIQAMRERVMAANKIVRSYLDTFETLIVVSHAGFYKFSQTILQNISSDQLNTIPNPENSKLLEFPFIDQL